MNLLLPTVVHSYFEESNTRIIAQELKFCPYFVSMQQSYFWLQIRVIDGSSGCVAVERYICCGRYCGLVPCRHVDIRGHSSEPSFATVSKEFELHLHNTHLP